jgi:hypothetical protein
VGIYYAIVDNDYHNGRILQTQLAHPIALLRSCRQIYHDTKLLPFLLNTFDFCSIKVLTNLELGQSLTLAQRSSIRTVEFSSNAVRPWDHVETFRWWKIDNAIPGIRQILPNVKSVKVKNSLLALCDKEEPGSIWNSNKVITQIVKKLVILWLEDGSEEVEITFES